MREYKLKDCKTLFVECHYCGKSFKAYRSRVARSHKVYCSMACRNQNALGSNNPNYKGKTKPRVCETCGREFKYLPGKHSVGRFCSQKCGWVALRRYITKGEALVLLDDLRVSDLPLPEFAKANKIGLGVLKRELRKYYPEKYENVMESRKLRFVDTYRRGREFEGRVKGYLESLNYIVMPSPRSMGPADLLAVRRGKILLVQCKAGGHLRKKGRVSLIEMAEQAGGIPLMAMDSESGVQMFKPNDKFRVKRKEYDPR